MTPNSALTQRMHTLHEAGMHTRDPVGWHYLQTLSSRAAQHSGAVLALLEDKLGRAIDAFEAGVHKHPAASPAETAPACSPLAQLLQEMQAERPRPKAPALLAGSTSPALATRLPPDNPRIRQFRRQLHSMGVQKQVRQAVAQGPQNAGPINSHMLTLRALVLLRERSPQYLERFMTHVDTLLRLEDAHKQPPEPAKGRASGKSKR